MPVVSKAQAGFMAMSRTPEGRAKLRAHGHKPAPVSVATEYLHASKGMNFRKLAKHVRGKHHG